MKLGSECWSQKRNVVIIIWHTKSDQKLHAWGIKEGVGTRLIVSQIKPMLLVEVGVAPETGFDCLTSVLHGVYQSSFWKK